MHNTSPRRPRRHLASIGIDLIPVQLTPAGVNVHLGCSEPALTLPEVSDNPEHNHNGCRKVLLEEALGGAYARATRRSRNGGVKLATPC